MEYVIVRRRLSGRAIALLAVTLILFVSWRAHSIGPRVWPVKEVPLAFWAWQLQTPVGADVQRALAETGAQALFLRAGQIDYSKPILRSIRSVKGVFPAGVEIHLVYNATPDLLTSLDSIEPAALVSTICESYLADAERGTRDGARVAGIQLDLDVPTRLLIRYEAILQQMRARLPAGTSLSITGLPTWMSSSDITGVLDAVDFWVPQCYGATIPNRLDQLTPISSPEMVARAIDGARQLGRPFYAGLAAYGYTIHYAGNGLLMQVIGSLDPVLLERSADLELIERRPFDETESGVETVSSEWRFVYRARRDCQVGGLIIRAGEYLMSDVPTVALLRASAQMVRERAGKKLLGICIFRLPGSLDPTTLTLKEMAVALSDEPPVIEAEVTIKLDDEGAGGEGGNRKRVAVRIENTGSASALMGDDAMRLDLFVAAGSVRAVNPDASFVSRMLCGLPDGNAMRGGDGTRPCGAGRATIIRLAARVFRPGARSSALLEFTGDPPRTIPVVITVKRFEGNTWRHEQTIRVGG